MVFFCFCHAQAEASPQRNTEHWSLARRFAAWAKPLATVAFEFVLYGDFVASLPSVSFPCTHTRVLLVLLSSCAERLFVFVVVVFVCWLRLLLHSTSLAFVCLIVRECVPNFYIVWMVFTASVLDSVQDQRKEEKEERERERERERDCDSTTLKVIVTTLLCCWLLQASRTFLFGFSQTQSFSPLSRTLRTGAAWIDLQRGETL